MAVRRELLEMRLDALEEDITKVEHVIDAAKERGKQLAQVKEKIGRSGIVMNPLLSVKTTVNTIADLLRINPALLDHIRRLNPGLPKQLSESLTYLETIRNGITQANETIDEIESTFVDLNALDPKLQEALADRCRLAKGKVTKLRSDLAVKPLRKVWGDYEGLTNNDCHALFSEYVDFLGGLTLRDTALDDGVCSMTDTLLELYIYVATQRSLALPVHHSPVGDTMRSLIKLGFPEWTIWSIPLVGNDIGQGIAQKIGSQEKFVPFVTELRSEQSLRQLLADAFATYTLGLAYGCAAITLRLQPHHDDGDPNTPTDVERASLILAILRRLTERGDPLDESIARLADHWTEAVEQLTDSKPVNAAWLDSLADVAWNEFSQLDVASYDGTRFAEGVTRWAATLAGQPVNEPADDDAVTDPLLATAPVTTSADAATVLELLNTAWKLRLEEPGAVKKVTANVRQLWSRAEPPSPAQDHRHDGSRQPPGVMARGL